MYKLSTIERAQILSALVEGNSIASTCRMFGGNKITVLRLLADAGTLAHRYHDENVRNLPTRRVQMDEIWSFVHCKQRNISPENTVNGAGDSWCWTAIDADSKLMIAWLVGPRMPKRPCNHERCSVASDRSRPTDNRWIHRILGCRLQCVQL